MTYLFKNFISDNITLFKNCHFDDYEYLFICDSNICNTCVNLNTGIFYNCYNCLV